MKVIKQVKHGGTNIFVLRHWILFMYFFSYKKQLYMQHLFPKPWQLFRTKDIVDAMVGHARRSIDVLQDPKAMHCPHGVNLNATQCAVCSNFKKKD